jgi:predicted negative regulator of RcsB-dependent stress response
MVEDYLTDRDQEEALRNWWQENWKWILAGIALGLGLLAAYQYWQTYRDRGRPRPPRCTPTCRRR